MKITKADAKAKIRQAYAHAVPDICDVILSDCEKGKGQVIMMEETKKKRHTVRYMMAAAACLVLLLGGGFGWNTYRLNHRVAATVSLEVNPSVQITVNEKERVLEVKALNRDGEIVIGDMDFSGSDINVVVNALIGSMLRNGYLNELANSILISVDNEDPAKGAALQEKLTKEVNRVLESDGFLGAVLSQTLTEKSTLQKQADRYGITLGKAQLIQDILDSTTGHTFEELVPLSINELNLLLTTAEADMAKVSTMGSASDKAYIGEEQALQTALAHAGISEEDIAFYRMDMDVEKGVMVYEIEFYNGGYKYEYEIDAVTGEFIKNKKEINEDFVTGTDQGVPSESVKVQPSDSVKETQDHYFGSYYGTEHHEEPVYEDHYYYENGTHHDDRRQSGGYYSGNGTDTGNGANAENGGNTSASITLEQAKEIALAHAGLKADAVYFDKAKQDYDDGILLYEIEFKAGGVEYGYEIDAQTGNILDYEWDYD